MKFKKWIVTSLLVLTFLTTNFVSPEIINFVTGGKSTSIVYALPRSGSSGFKSGSFKSSTFKSGGYKSGSFKSGSSIFGGFSSSNKGSSYGGYSTRRSFIPIPFFFHNNYGGHSLFGGLFAGYLIGKLIKWALIILVIYIIYRLFIKRRY
jgi:hypothetical protein